MSSIVEGILRSRLPRFTGKAARLLSLRYSPRTIMGLEIVMKIIMIAILARVVFQYGRAHRGNFSDPLPPTWSGTEGILALFLVSECLYELGEMTLTSSQKMKEYFAEDWNYLDMIVGIGGLVWIILRSIPPLSNAGRVLLSLLAIPQAMGLLRYLSLFRNLGELVIIVKVMARDLLTFFVLYAVTVLGFSICLRGLFYKTHLFTTNASTILTLFSATVNNFEFNIFSSDSNTVNGIGVILTVVFVAVVSILLINLLIARMTTSFQRISDQSFREWSFEKASMVRKYVLLKEKNVYCMLPALLNIIPILLTVGGVYTTYAILGSDERVSWGGTVCDIVLLIVFTPLRILVFDFTVLRAAWRKKSITEWLLVPVRWFFAAPLDAYSIIYRSGMYVDVEGDWLLKLSSDGHFSFMQQIVDEQRAKRLRMISTSDAISTRSVHGRHYAMIEDDPLVTSEHGRRLSTPSTPQSVREVSSDRRQGSTDLTNKQRGRHRNAIDNTMLHYQASSQSAGLQDREDGHVLTDEDVSRILLPLIRRDDELSLTQTSRAHIVNGVHSDFDHQLQQQTRQQQDLLNEQLKEQEKRQKVQMDQLREQQQQLRLQVDACMQSQQDMMLKVQKQLEIIANTLEHR